MALMRWDDEEDKKDEPNIRRIASLQSSWQPSPSGANSAVATNDITNRASGNNIFSQQQAQSGPVDNYLMSEEKAKNDEQRRRREAQIAEARRQAAAQAAYAAQQQAQQAQQTQQSDGNAVVDDTAR